MSAIQVVPSDSPATGHQGQHSQGHRGGADGFRRGRRHVATWTMRYRQAGTVWTGSFERLIRPIKSFACRGNYSLKIRDATRFLPLGNLHATGANRQLGFSNLVCDLGFCCDFCLQIKISIFFFFAKAFDRGAFWGGRTNHQRHKFTGLDPEFSFLENSSQPRTFWV